MSLLSQILLYVIWHCHHDQATPFSFPFATVGAIHPSGDGSKSYMISLGDTGSSSRMERGAHISFTQMDETHRHAPSLPVTVSVLRPHLLYCNAICTHVIPLDLPLLPSDTPPVHIPFACISSLHSTYSNLGAARTVVFTMPRDRGMD